MQTQLTIAIRAVNNNVKTHALFDKTEFSLIYEGKTIANLTQDEFEVDKKSSVLYNYLVKAYPIQLNQRMMRVIDFAYKEDVITFALKGGSKARWRVGPLGWVQFRCNLSCGLRFRPSDQSYLASACTSAANEN